MKCNHSKSIKISVSFSDVPFAGVLYRASLEGEGGQEDGGGDHSKNQLAANRPRSQRARTNLWATGQLVFNIYYLLKC